LKSMANTGIHKRSPASPMANQIGLGIKQRQYSNPSV
jgi:hypothetical protein